MIARVRKHVCDRDIEEKGRRHTKVETRAERRTKPERQRYLIIASTCSRHALRRADHPVPHSPIHHWGSRRDHAAWVRKHFLQDMELVTNAHRMGRVKRRTQHRMLDIIRARDIHAALPAPLQQWLDIRALVPAARLGRQGLHVPVIRHSADIGVAEGGLTQLREAVV